MKRSIGIFGHIGTETWETSMIHTCGLSLSMLLGIAGILVGCGGDPGQHGSSSSGVDAGEPSANDGGTSAAAGQPPKPTSDRPPCILSADCPTGLHCDLGECIQECNTSVACSGDKTCSTRARCLEQDQPDVDPAPPSVTAGTLDITPTAINLTRANSGKTINLNVTTTSTDEVRYRVEVDAPYLSVAQVRGSFTSQATIPIKVDTSNIVARDIAGSVTIYSTLGTTTIQLPLHTGLTGHYHGSLKYNGDAVVLGDTRFDLEIIENNGDVSARIAPEHSMLFPKGATDDDVAYGFGSLSGDGTVDLTIDHLLDGSAGGANNHFGRTIGRRFVMHLNAPATGIFDGTFNESIYGLFEGPVQTKGAVHLEFVPEATDPNFQTHSVEMPTVSSSSDLFPVAFASNFPAASSDCASIPASDATVLSGAYGTLYASVGNTSTKYTDLSKDCQSILGMGTNPATSNTCGWVATEACLMRNYAQGSNYATKGAAEGALAQAILAPAALVAQEELVAALRDSVVNGKGLATELSHYDTALSALAPIAKWLMQPGMLEFFRNIPASSAETSPSAFIPTLSGTAAESYPLARALAQLVQLLIDVNAERQRVANITTTTNETSRNVQAQYNSTITYLEAVALLGVLDSWAVSPPAATATVTGVLTKLDHSFTDMTQDAGDNLGTPSRHVPFVYRAEDTSSGATNFEQKLTIAGKAVTQLQTHEADFKTDAQQVDQAAYVNQTQLQNAQDTLDTQIHTICGSDFNLSPSSGTVDWTTCGKTGSTLNDAELEILSAQTAAQATAQRAQGQKDKIDIDVHLVAQKKQMRDDELAFIDSSNQQIVANDETINFINAIQQMLQMASNSNLWNVGAPAVMAVADYGLDLEKSALQEDNVQLQQAEDMDVKQTDADIEYADGMANIKREEIDLAEMVIEARQSVIGVLEAQVKAASALSQAEELYANRTKTHQLISSDPSTDPSYRLVRDQASLQYLGARDTAQQQLLSAGRALEYEMDHDLPTLATAVQSARNYTALNALQSCLDSIFDQFNELYSSPQPFSTTVSVRKLFGITGPRTDEVTGKTLSEGEQFRAYVLNNQSLDPDGTLRIQFSTNLMPGNGLWSTETCVDKISEVQAQLVGDYLGDNEAQVDIALSGTSVLRSCDTNELENWNLDSNSVAVIQAGVNTFGDVTSTSLFGQSVARATWTLSIPGSDAGPSNADVDVSHLDDIVLKIKHNAIPLQTSSAASLDDSCLTDVINSGA